MLAVKVVNVDNSEEHRRTLPLSCEAVANHKRAKFMEPLGARIFSVHYQCKWSGFYARRKWSGHEEDIHRSGKIKVQQYLLRLPGDAVCLLDQFEACESIGFRHRRTK